jgi:type 1 glutamine amidotransferase
MHARYLLVGVMALAALALPGFAQDAYEPPAADATAAEISPEVRAQIDAALPTTAPAEPARPRKLLIVDLNMGRGGHPSIPSANYAVARMGEITGAYETTICHDQSMLDPGHLAGFDALYLNNTIGPLFDTPERQAALLALLERGGGLIANHAVTATSTEWEEFGYIIGARGTYHREADERVTVRIDAPGHPVIAAFGDQPFELVDEFFRFDSPPYARDSVQVLLSIDHEKTDMHQGPDAGGTIREDNDYPISWVHEHSGGRVFYTSLGHNAHIFQDPRILEHFLAGIQYALGDLDAEP